MENFFKCYDEETNDCYCDNCNIDIVNGEPCTLESYNNNYCKCCNRKHEENFKEKYCNNCIHKEDTENIKTLELTETVIKEKDDIKLVKIVRKVQIANTKGTSKRYEVRYADNRRISGIAGETEEDVISLFDKIKRD